MNKPDIPNFTIEQELGQGGMATVYLATQVLLNRKIAMKIVSPEYSQASFQEVFLHEGKVIAQLEHPNIVKIYDIGITDNSFYMAMEYLAGGSLRDRLETETFIPSQVLQILEQVGDGLEFSHQQGFIHRDIKPENILFHQNGTAVLTDFGIAKLQNTTGEMTRMGYMAGTAHYMSPEQAATSELDNRSDLYSLGLVIFEMLSGEKVCKADSLIQAIHQHTVTPPPTLPEKYQLFQPVLHKALAKQPEDRYHSVKQFVDAFSHAVNNFNSSQQTEYSANSGETRLFESDHVNTTTIQQTSHTARPATVTLQEEETPLWQKPLVIASIVAVIASILAFFFITWMVTPTTLPTSNQSTDFSGSSDSSTQTTTVSLPVAPPNNTPPPEKQTNSQESETDSQANEPVTEKPTVIVKPAVDTKPELPSGQTIPGITGQIFIVSSSDNLNLRTTPRVPRIKTENIVGKLKPGARVTIASDVTFPRKTAKLTGKWVKINHSGQTGYVVDTYLRPAPEIKSGGKPTPNLQGKGFVIKKENTKVFAEPFSDTTSETPRALLQAGVVVIAQENMRYPDKAWGPSTSWIKVKGGTWEGYLLDINAFPLNKNNKERIKFAPEAVSINVQGQLSHLGTKRYVLRALEGQQIRVQNLNTLPSTVTLFVYGEDNQVLGFNTKKVDKLLPSTQDYYITFFGSDNQQTPFHYEIFIQ